MLKFVSSIGDAAYNTATKSGLTAGAEQPPYPCALPFQVIENANDVVQAEAILDHTYESVREMFSGEFQMLFASLTNPKKCTSWKKVDYSDPKGDIELFTRPHVGPYNFARATFTMEKTHPVTILNRMMSQDLSVRQQYSPNLTKYEVLLRNPKIPASAFPRDPATGAEVLGQDNYQLEQLQKQGCRVWHVEYNYYAAPPPVASRDFVYLIEKRYVPEEDAYYLYGTCVDYVDTVYRKSKCVRGAVMFGWRFQFVDGDTKCTYCSAMNPNGWAPTFIVGWMKTEIGKEFQNSRRLTYLEPSREEDIKWYYNSKQQHQKEAAEPEPARPKAVQQGRQGYFSASSHQDSEFESDLDSEFDRQQTEEIGNEMLTEDPRIDNCDEDLIIIE